MGDFLKRKAKDREAARLGRLRKLLAGGTGAPAIDFQRFCLAGLDRKGQRVSGFGEIGGGFKVDGGVNFGPAICPGVVTLAVGASLTGEAVGRSLLLVQRDAASLCYGVPKRHAPDWKNDCPIAMNLLDGWSFHGRLGAGANASVGVGDPLKADEMGLSLGVEAGAEGGFDLLTLEAERPIYYRSAHGDDFETDFNDLVNHKVKRAVALFLMYAKKRDILGEALGKFTPDGPMDPRVDQMLRAAFKDRPEVGTELNSWAYAFSADFKNLFKWFETQIRLYGDRHGSYNPKKWSFGISTKDLIDKLGYKITLEYDRYLITEKSNYKDNWKKYYAATSDGDAREIMREIEFYERVSELYENLCIALTMLRNRRTRKLTGRKAPLALGDKVESAVRTKVRATVWTYELKTGAGAKGNLSVDTVVGVVAAAKAVGKVEGSWTSAIFDTATDPGRFKAGRAPKRLLTREHTIIRKFATELGSDAIAAAWAPKRPTKSATAEARSLYGTMVYESVRLCRFEGEIRARVGSGVSSGASILVKRLKLVTAAKASGTKLADLDDKTRKVLKYLSKTLCVHEKILFDFLDKVDLDWTPDDVAVLAEASFEFAGGTVDVYDKDRENLHDFRPAKKKIDQKKPDDPQARNKDRGNGSTRLQVLRLRLRQTKSGEKRRDIFSVGYIEDLPGSSKGRGSINASIFRTYRAGVENTIDFAVKYYGPHEQIFNDDKNNDIAYEYTTAPVSLFNF